MERKKVVYVADAGVTEEVMNSPEVKKMLDPIWEKYNVDFSTVQDITNEALAEMGLDSTTYAEKFEKNGPEWYKTPDHVLKAVEDADVILMHYTQAPKMLIDAAKKCKLILAMRGGYENVNVEYATEKGIQVANSPFANNYTVPDFTIGMMLAASRNIVKNEIGFNKGAWNRDMENTEYPVHCMRFMKIGLMGFGSIAQSVAHKLSGFGCKILVSDPFVPDEVIQNAGCIPVTAEELLQQSDIVSIHVRLLPATKGMFKKEYFDLMKPTAWIVNTARAGLIDTPAMIEALQTKKIAGAALDVFDNEPLPADSPFFKMDNVILEPHIAGSTSDGMVVRIKAPLDDLVNYFETGEIKAKVNFR